MRKTPPLTLLVLAFLFSCKTSEPMEDSAVLNTTGTPSLPELILHEAYDYNGEFNGSLNVLSITAYDDTAGQHKLQRDPTQPGATAENGYMKVSHKVKVAGLRTVSRANCTDSSDVTFTLPSGDAYSVPLKKICGLPLRKYEYETAKLTPCANLFHIIKGQKVELSESAQCYGMLKSTGGFGVSFIVYPQSGVASQKISDALILGAVSKAPALPPTVPVSATVEKTFEAPLGSELLEVTKDLVVEDFKRLRKKTESRKSYEEDYRSCLLNPRSNNWSDLQAYYYCHYTYSFRSGCFSSSLIADLYSLANMTELGSAPPEARAPLQAKQAYLAAESAYKKCFVNTAKYQSELGSTETERKKAAAVFRRLMVDGNLLAFNIKEQHEILDAALGDELDRRAEDRFEAKNLEEISDGSAYGQPNQLRHCRVLKRQLAAMKKDHSALVCR